MINKANIYEQLTALPYLSAYQQLIQGAIELDVFSELENPITVKELSEKMNWDETRRRAPGAFLGRRAGTLRRRRCCTITARTVPSGCAAFCPG